MRLSKLARSAMCGVLWSCIFEVAVAQTAPDAAISRADRIQSCSRKSPIIDCMRATRTDPSATASKPIRSLVAIETAELELHPSWSPLERNTVLRKARDAFAEEIQHSDNLILSPQSGEARFHIKLAFYFRSAAFSNRTLDQWVNLPRSMAMSVEITDALQPGLSTAKSTIELSTGLSARPRLGFDNNARWYKRYSAAIAQEAGKTLLKIDQPADVLTVVTDATGKSFIDGSGLSFPNTAMLVLLVPRDARISMSDWPIATVTPTSLTKSFHLDFLRGSREACRDGCIAARL